MNCDKVGDSDTALAPCPSAMMSVHGHRCIIMLPRQHKGHLAVTDQGQLLPRRIMHCIKLCAPVGTGLNLSREIGHIDGLYIDNTAVCIVELVGCVHLSYPFLMLIV